MVQAATRLLSHHTRLAWSHSIVQFCSPLLVVVGRVELSLGSGLSRAKNRCLTVRRPSLCAQSSDHQTRTLGPRHDPLLRMLPRTAPAASSRFVSRLVSSHLEILDEDELEARHDGTVERVGLVQQPRCDDLNDGSRTESCDSQSRRDRLPSPLRSKGEEATAWPPSCDSQSCRDRLPSPLRSKGEEVTAWPPTSSSSVRSSTSSPKFATSSGVLLVESSAPWNAALACSAITPAWTWHADRDTND